MQLSNIYTPISISGLQRIAHIYKFEEFYTFYTCT